MRTRAITYCGAGSSSNGSHKENPFCTADKEQGTGVCVRVLAPAGGSRCWGRMARCLLDVSLPCKAGPLGEHEK